MQYFLTHLCRKFLCRKEWFIFDRFWITDSIPSVTNEILKMSHMHSKNEVFELLPQIMFYVLLFIYLRVYYYFWNYLFDVWMPWNELISIQVLVVSISYVHVCVVCILIIVVHLIIFSCKCLYPMWMEILSHLWYAQFHLI